MSHIFVRKEKLQNRWFSAWYKMFLPLTVSNIFGIANSQFIKIDLQIVICQLLICTLMAKGKKTISCYFLEIIFVDCVNYIRKTSRAWFFNQVIWMCFMSVIIFCCIFSYRYIHDWTRVWSFRSRTEKKYWKTENCIV